MEYSFERVTEERLSDLLPVFEEAFGEKPEIAELKQKHSTASLGSRDLGYIAFSPDQTAAAYYGVFALRLRVGDQVVVASQSGDTMVRPDHERRGLFTRLAKKTYDLCIDNSIRGVVGFPSASSYPGFVTKLNWAHKENFRRYQFWIPTLPLAESTSRLKFGRGMVLKWQRMLSRFYKNGHPFTGSILEDGFDGVYRDEHFWCYKLQGQKTCLREIRGCQTVFKLEGSLGVGDVDYKTLKDLKKVIRSLKYFCFFSGINRIVFYVSPGTRLDNDLARLARSSEGLPIGYRSFDSELDLQSIKYCYLDMDTF